jgi:regulator of sigma E protease
VNFLAFLPILSLMMFVHELGHFLTARLAGITVQEFGFGLPPRLWGFKHGGIIYSINWIPFGAFVKMLGEEDPTAPGSFASKPRLVRIGVLAAGSGMNFLLAVVAFSLVYIVGVPRLSADGPVRLGGIAADSPAAAAGLEAGDVVLSFNGQPVNLQQFRDLTQQHLDEPVRLEVRRGNQQIETSLTPRSNPPEGQGALGVILESNDLARLDPIHAVGLGATQSLRAVGITFMVPVPLVQGAITPGDARPIGLVGMAQLTSQTVDYAVDTGFWYPIFVLTGMFSAGLSLANLLPIPALDGGRLFFVILESLRGRRIPPEREAAYHFAGIVLLLALMLLISLNDVFSPLPALNWGPR